MTANTPKHSDSEAATGLQVQEPTIPGITTVTLRPIASPMPLGLFTLAIASAVVSAVEVGIIPESSFRAVSLIIAPAFLLQLVAAIFAFLSRDTIAATVLASFASTWLVGALAFFINPPDIGKALGIYYFVFSIFVLLILSLAKSKLVLSAIMVCAVLRFVSSGIYEFTNSSAAGLVAGIVGFVLTIVALYGAHSLLAEDVTGRAPFPVGRSGMARAAMEGPLSQQLEGLEHSAGVRRTL
ncbi:MAG: hypothetical protein JWP13_943 [Candidatus Saccharibacteria bacterium]|nr:hypothetical protein [Candidatus Saccharibacteria bacterium]